MKINTSTLMGAALDWAVAKCNGTLGYYVQPNAKRGTTLWKVIPSTRRYSTTWAFGGPIIDRERISVLPFDGRWEARCAASITRTPARFIERRGPTPLVAAMRCYVASKLGDTVDVPDELMGVPMKA